jgi:quercetin dioxygenase-like cupin family protein
MSTKIEGETMPKASKLSATEVADLGVLETRSAELAEYTVEFTAFREDADGTPFFKGLPGDRCQSPHWGYVLRGELTFRYADHDETYAAGDAYFAPPGHIPVVTARTEVVEFSPTEEYRRTLEVVSENFAAAQAG